ncbi:MAG TPA: hypothetical protein VFL14_12935, partial [Xanthomonadales bacterium]|nr:hypothetical protein [Xanthomonadales bacterium]
AELFDPAHARAPTGARAWNLGVLAAAGGAISFVDNDTTFPLRRAPDARDAYEPRNSPVATTRYLDAGEYDTLPALDVEPYGWLARHVGASARTMIERHGWDEAALAGQPADALAHCRSDATVVAASGGVYGGLAFNSSAWLNTGSPEKLAGLWRAPYRHERLEADSLMHGVIAPRLVDTAWYAPALCDARELLPFTGTLALADDTFFLGLLGALCRQPLFSYVPTLLGHFPVERRSRLQRSLEPLLLDRNGLVCELFGDVAKTLRGDDRATRLRAIGAVCADLAAASDATLASTVLAWRQPRIAGLVDALSASLASAGAAPAEWRAHAVRVRAVNREAAIADRVGPDELERWRWLLGQCAFAAEAWPLLWNDALERPLLEGLALQPE